ncbi:MAG: DUF3592 domain-containing protein [Oscillospiraceae bacterium]|nr:DUF3592 domain-containing protein [Oscillospiraceae bacterium]
MRKTFQSIIFIVVGALVAVFGLTMYVREKQIETVCSSSTSGVITDVRSFSISRQRKKHTKKPSVSYSKEQYVPEATYTIGDISYTVEGDGLNEPVSEGETVTIMYNPSDPSEAYILDYYNNAYGFITLFGAAFVVLGILAAVVKKGKRYH